jgi:hypothetical protein
MRRWLNSIHSGGDFARKIGAGFEGGKAAGRPTLTTDGTVRENW